MKKLTKSAARNPEIARTLDRIEKKLSRAERNANDIKVIREFDSARKPKSQHGGARAGSGWKRDAAKISIGRFRIQSGATVLASVICSDGEAKMPLQTGILSLRGHQIVVTLNCWGETITIEAV